MAIYQKKSADDYCVDLYAHNRRQRWKAGSHKQQVELVEAKLGVEIAEGKCMDIQIALSKEACNKAVILKVNELLLNITCITKKFEPEVKKPTIVTMPSLRLQDGSKTRFDAGESMQEQPEVKERGPGSDGQ